MAQIENGAGDGTRAKVNKRNELTVFSVQESEAQYATEHGDAYNINTGEGTLASSTSSGLLYFKNDENYDVVIEAIAFGLRDVTGGDGSQKLTVIRNPTGGTLVDAATSVDINQNRNFGSSQALKATSLAYKATASNQTLTGGDDILLLYAGTGRLLATINLDVPRGSAVGLRLDCTSIAANYYAALIVHTKDSLR